jgi:hypothetical protein
MLAHVQHHATPPLARAATVLAFLLGIAPAACGDDPDDPPRADATDAGADRFAAAPRVGPPDAALDSATPDAPFEAGLCNARVDAPAVMSSPHVPDGSPVVYNSNPPSSGPHYDSWANFGEVTQPVDDRYLVHSMEHGAVLLLYRCEGAACAPIVEALRAVRDAIPTDPLCDPSIRVRIILAPRPANEVAVAAAAWGHTYRADCVDAPSLTRFVLDHYAKAPENFCAPGQTF